MDRVRVLAGHLGVSNVQGISFSLWLLHSLKRSFARPFFVPASSEACSNVLDFNPATLLWYHSVESVMTLRYSKQCSFGLDDVVGSCLLVHLPACVLKSHLPDEYSGNPSNVPTHPQDHQRKQLARSSGARPRLPRPTMRASLTRRPWPTFRLQRMMSSSLMIC